MKNNDTWMRSKVNIQSHLNKSVTDSDRFFSSFVYACMCERANVFLNKSNKTISFKRRSRECARQCLCTNNSPPRALYKQTHVNNVINRHLIFVKCLLGFWVKRTKIINKGNKTNRPTIQSIEIFVVVFLKRTHISLFQMFLCESFSSFMSLANCK